MRRAPAVLALCLVSAGLLSGCLTGTYLPRIGARHDRVASFERARSNGTELILYYRMNTYAGELTVGAEPEATGLERWSRLDLRGLGWAPLEAGRTLGAPGVVRLVIEDGPPPTLGADYVEVPVFTIPALHQARIVGEAVPHLLSTAEPHALSLHQWDTRGEPAYVSAILVRRTAGGGFEHNDRIKPPIREYETAWAVPARVFAAPVLFICDMLLTPAILLCLVGKCSM